MNPLDPHELRVSQCHFPYGTCQCGCGQKTEIAKRSHNKKGLVKGKPNFCLDGHKQRQGNVACTYHGLDLLKLHELRISLCFFPYGTCQCGCGQTTPIAVRSRPEKGIVKGTPTFLISGHPWRQDKFLSQAMKKCPKCNYRKPKNEFYNHRSQSDGLTSYCAKCHNKHASEWKNRNPDKAKKMKRGIYLKCHYKITLAEYETALANQNGVCAICLLPETQRDKNGKTRNIAIDHNHRTGKFRGLLCNGCNAGIGHFQDVPDRLRRAATYLEEREE